MPLVEKGALSRGTYWRGRLEWCHLIKYLQNDKNFEAQNFHPQTYLAVGKSFLGENTSEVLGRRSRQQLAVRLNWQKDLDVLSLVLVFELVGHKDV